MRKQLINRSETIERIMLNKINVCAIISGHIKTLRKFGNPTIYWRDIFIFFIAPISCSFLAAKFELTLDKDVAAIITTIASIFAGLLLNLLMLIYTILIKEKKESCCNTLKISLIHELYFNISYCILVSIIMLATCLFYSRLIFGIDIASPFVFWLIANLFLTILMVLKRINAIFDNEINAP